jgi:hypothetical protein
MRARRLSRATLLVLIVAACQTGVDDPATPPADGAASPEEAVEQLVELLNIPDFASASALAYPGHSALAALAEGATFGEVADALDTGDGEVAANFWAGFAQGTGSFLTGPVTMTGGPLAVEDGEEFHRVLVTAAGGEERVMLTRDSNGHRVDLFASFGAGLAERMIPPVERLLTTSTEDARDILRALQATVPSLLVAADEEDVSGEASQALTRLIELITRSA